MNKHTDYISSTIPCVLISLVAMLFAVGYLASYTTVNCTGFVSFCWRAKSNVRNLSQAHNSVSIP